ncbi:MAG: hypothetical protein M3H12_18415, partial [Chromatiales bacterium]
MEKPCNFGDEKENNLRDQLVYGCHDDSLREKLFREETLTLQNASQIATAHEAARQNMNVFHEQQTHDLPAATTDRLKQLKNLNQNTATGPDELPGRVLKKTAAEIAPIITHIFQQSYNTCKLPDNWLQALVTPIHKKGTNQTANYRPISLTCILCKVMEHIILSNMWK